jgi:gamma-glutamylcyclotransferase (GGCT)/AIG2-like uncharacterized protein YtfP
MTNESPVFAYGTLMFPEVARCVAGDLGVGEPAEIDNYARFQATTRRRGNYPYITPRRGESVSGLLFRDVSPTQLKQLDWFEEEGTLYHRVAVQQIRIAGEATDLDVWIYVIGPELDAQIDAYARKQQAPRSEISWDSERFFEEEIEVYMKKIVLPAVCGIQYAKEFGEPIDVDYVAEMTCRFGE